MQNTSWDTAANQLHVAASFNAAFQAPSTKSCTGLFPGVENCGLSPIIAWGAAVSCQTTVYTKILTRSTKELTTELKTRVTPEFLREMYKSNSRRSFVYDSFESICEAIIRKRPKIFLPPAQAVHAAIESIEEAALGGGDQLSQTSLAPP